MTCLSRWRHTSSSPVLQWCPQTVLLHWPFVRLCLSLYMWLQHLYVSCTYWDWETFSVYPEYTIETWICEDSTCFKVMLHSASSPLSSLYCGDSFIERLLKAPNYAVCWALRAAALSSSVVVFKTGLGLKTSFETTLSRSWSHLGIDYIFTRSWSNQTRDSVKTKAAVTSLFLFL